MLDCRKYSDKRGLTMKTSKKIILLLIHLFIAVVTILLTLKGVLLGAGQGQLGENMINLGYFKAFTVDSNDLAAISSLIMVVILLKNLITKKDHIPYWATLLNYTSGVAVGLTFITTATFLAPTQVSIGNSYFLYFSGDMFFLHFLTPLLVIGTYIFGEKEFKFNKKENFISLLPLFFYSIVYVTCAVITHVWTDFYGFTFGGHNSVVVPVLIVIYIVTFLIGFAMRKVHNKLAGK